MSFTMDLKNFGDNALEKANVIKRKGALEIFTRVVLETPVKSGRARGNWQCSTGSEKTDELDTSDQNRAIPEISNVVMRSELKDVIFLSNNVPYIGRLNDGYSKQAPSGFIEKAIALYPGVIEDAAND